MADPTARDLMVPSSFVLTATADTPVSRVLERVRPGQIVVVEENRVPLGVSVEDVLQTLRDPGSYIGDYLDVLSVPTITAPGTSARTLVGGMMSDPAVRYPLVRQGGDTLGVVTPGVLSLLGSGTAGAAAALGTPSLFAGAFSAFAGLYGPPNTVPVDPCYCCQGTPRHCLCKADAELDLGYPHQLYCRHDGTRMLPHLPCPEPGC